MSTLDFTILDLDFPVGSKNKTATLVTGEREALLVDAGFTRADGHRLAAAVLDSGKTLTTVFISHADPDFYFGAEVIADAFPDAVFVATPLVIEHIQHSYEGKLKAWEALGANLPTRLVDLTPLTGDLVLEGHRVRAQGRPGRAARPPLPVAARAPRHPRRRPAVRPASTSGSPTPPSPSSAPPGSTLLDEMAALNPELVVPGHRLPGTPADATAITGTRDYLTAFEAELGHGRRRRGADRGPRRALPRPRHADRRADRREGRQGRDDLGLTAMTRPTADFAASTAPRTWCAASTWPPPPATWRRCAPRWHRTSNGPRWPASRWPAPTAPPTGSPPT